MILDPGKYSSVWYVGGFSADDGNGGSSPTDAGGWTMPNNFDLDADGASIAVSSPVTFNGRVKGGIWNGPNSFFNSVVFSLYSDSSGASFADADATQSAVMVFGGFHQKMRVTATINSGCALTVAGLAYFEDSEFFGGNQRAQ